MRGDCKHGSVAVTTDQQCTYLPHPLQCGHIRDIWVGIDWDTCPVGMVLIIHDSRDAGNFMRGGGEGGGSLLLPHIVCGGI